MQGTRLAEEGDEMVRSGPDGLGSLGDDIKMGYEELHRLLLEWMRMMPRNQLQVLLNQQQLIQQQMGHRGEMVG